MKLGMFVSLRRCVLAAPVVWALSPGAAMAIDVDAGRIAIVDTSQNTKPFLDALARAGVRVIGRYYARCRQPGLEEKRLVGNAGEVEAILAHPRKFAVLSIYQFYNNSPLKFSGRREIRCKPRTGKTKMITVTLPDEACQERAIDADCNEAEGPAHTLAMEATYDAEAAVRQAQEVRQPIGTAIYFGVDFNSGSSINSAVLEYFGIVGEILGAKGYQVGVYGNGAALRFLMGKVHTATPLAHKALVDFFWLSASRGHAGSSAQFNSGDWDLFQTRIDMRLDVFGGLELDTDVQNGLRPDRYVGFWNRAGPFKVDEDRTKLIHNQRRFTCSGLARIYASASNTQQRADGFFCGRGRGELDCDQRVAGGKPLFETDLSPRLCLGDVTRVGVESNGFVQVDCDEDGQFDGWVAAANLSSAFATRPTWIDIPRDSGKRDARRSLKREATDCR
jgi:Rv2525c-like, glycoside hydrolase-like domain